MNAAPNDRCRPAVRKDWAWAKAHESESLHYIRDYVFDRWCRDSSLTEDLQRATDYVIETPQHVKIGMRIRRISNTGRKRHFTLRLSRPSGCKTEQAKLAEAALDYYCYCWINDRQGGRLEEYIIIDMQRFLESGLLKKPDGIERCHDESARFSWWDWTTLQDHNCIAEGVKYPGQAVSFRVRVPFRPGP